MFAAVRSSSGGGLTGLLEVWRGCACVGADASGIDLGVIEAPHREVGVDAFAGGYGDVVGLEVVRHLVQRAVRAAMLQDKGVA